MKGKSRNIEIAVMGTIIVAVILTIFAILKMSAGRYAGKECIASIMVSGETHTDTADAFEEKHEYRKGDSISFAGVSLKITDITRHGEVCFTVESGSLYDSNKNAVTSAALIRDEAAYYSTDNGTVKLLVINTEFQ
ncbi:MAG: hypothetical protein J6M17_12970 [Ruminococcus sp.]|nr:hypothetical protein [Ruminococcus sp.]